MDLMSIINDFLSDSSGDFVQNVMTSDTITSLYYNVFLPENSIGILDINSIYITATTIASALSIIVFIKKMMECYFTWQSGDPDTNPLVIVVNFIKAIIAMLIFGEVYRIVIPLGYEAYSDFAGSITYGTVTGTDLSESSLGNGFWQSIASIVYICCYIALYFQLLMRGVETLVLRAIVPFTCIGLINSDGGSFNVMVKRFIQNISTVIIQLLLAGIAWYFSFAGHLIWGICFAMVALRTPSFISEFLIVRQGTPVSQRVGQAATGIASAYRYFKK